MDRHVFTNDIAVANYGGAAVFLREPDALRQASERRALEDMVVLADDNAFFNGNARFQDRSVSDLGVLFHNAERSDLNVLPQLCAGRH